MHRRIAGLLSVVGLVTIAALDGSEESARPALASEPDTGIADCVGRDAAIRAASRYVASQGGADLATSVDAVWSEARWTVFFWGGEDSAHAPVWIDVAADGRIAGCDAGGICPPADAASVPACGAAGSAPVSRDDAERIAREFLAGRLPEQAPRNSLALWSEASWLVFFEAAAAADRAGFIVEVSPSGEAADRASGA